MLVAAAAAPAAAAILSEMLACNVPVCRGQESASRHTYSGYYKSSSRVSLTLAETVMPLQLNSLSSCGGMHVTVLQLVPFASILLLVGLSIVATDSPPCGESHSSHQYRTVAKTSIMPLHLSNTTIRAVSLIILVPKEEPPAVTDYDAPLNSPHACPVASQHMQAYPQMQTVRPARNCPRINVAASFAELEQDAAQVIAGASALSPAARTRISHRDDLDEFQLRMIEQAALSLCVHCTKLQTLVAGATGGPVPSHLVLPEALLLG
jgi:hypothetical protein